MATQNAVNTSLFGQSGTGAFAGSVSPSFTTPTLGAASATTINKVTFTTPATGSTLTIADGKTLTIDNRMTTTANDGATVAFGGGGTVLYSGGVGGFAWLNVSGTTQAAAINTGYICSNAGATTVTLPATAAQGSVVGVASANAGGFVFAANTGQTIKFLGQTTTSGGSWTSAEQYDVMIALCIVADTTWMIIQAPGSGYTPA